MHKAKNIRSQTCLLLECSIFLKDTTIPDQDGLQTENNSPFFQFFVQVFVGWQIIFFENLKESILSFFLQLNIFLPWGQKRTMKSLKIPDGFVCTAVRKRQIQLAIEKYTLQSGQIYFFFTFSNWYAALLCALLWERGAISSKLALAQVNWNWCWRKTISLLQSFRYFRYFKPVKYLCYFAPRVYTSFWRLTTFEYVQYQRIFAVTKFPGH